MERELCLLTLFVIKIPLMKERNSERALYYERRLHGIEQPLNVEGTDKSKVMVTYS